MYKNELKSLYIHIVMKKVRTYSFVQLKIA